MSSNLPPGVTNNMIEGDGSEAAFEKLCDDIYASGLDAEEAYFAWMIGFNAIKELRKRGWGTPLVMQELKFRYAVERERDST